MKFLYALWIPLLFPIFASTQAVESLTFGTENEDLITFGIENKDSLVNATEVMVQELSQTEHNDSEKAVGLYIWLIVADQLLADMGGLLGEQVLNSLGKLDESLRNEIWAKVGSNIGADNTQKMIDEVKKILKPAFKKQQSNAPSQIKLFCKEAVAKEKKKQTAKQIVSNLNILFNKHPLDQPSEDLCKQVATDLTEQVSIAQAIYHHQIIQFLYLEAEINTRLQSPHSSTTRYQALVKNLAERFEIDNKLIPVIKDTLALYKDRLASMQRNLALPIFNLIFADK